MLLQSKHNKISDSLCVRGGNTSSISTQKMESDKEKPEKEINLLLSCVRWDWIVTKIMLLKENSRVAHLSALGLLSC